MSAIVLDELIRSLNSKKEKMTIQEAEIFKEWKSDAIGGVALGGSVATALTWMATRKLNVFNRLGLAGGAGFLTAAWNMNKALDSCVDHILGLDGTRMQQELNRIILERYGNDPKKMQLYSKYFYGEEVFNDSTPGLPKLVYRPRNLYMDEHRTSDVNTSQESVERGLYHARRNDDTNIKLKTPSSEIKKNPRNPGINVFGYGDPLDVLFGDSSANENPDQPDKSGKSAKSQSHSQRRAHRRRRARLRYEESSSVGMTQLHGG